MTEDFKSDAKEVKHPNEEQWVKNSNEMRSVYISGPITAESAEKETDNIMRARKVYWQLIKKGFAVYCPHTMSARVGIRHEKGVTHDVIMPNDLFWVKTCDITLMLPGYDKSTGCMAELRFAEELKKKIYYSFDELIETECNQK